MYNFIVHLKDVPFNPIQIVTCLWRILLNSKPLFMIHDNPNISDNLKVMAHEEDRDVPDAKRKDRRALSSDKAGGENPEKI